MPISTEDIPELIRAVEESTSENPITFYHDGQFKVIDAGTTPSFKAETGKLSLKIGGNPRTYKIINILYVKTQEDDSFEVSFGVAMG